MGQEERVLWEKLIDSISTAMFVVWLTTALCVFGLVTTLMFFAWGLT
jgi:hypothetical protein